MNRLELRDMAWNGDVIGMSGFIGKISEKNLEDSIFYLRQTCLYKNEIKGWVGFYKRVENFCKSKGIDPDKELRAYRDWETTQIGRAHV